MTPRGAIVIVMGVSGTGKSTVAQALARQGHFMQADLLRSQFSTLEEPTEKADVWVADSAQPVAAIVDRTVEHFSF